MQTVNFVEYMYVCVYVCECMYLYMCQILFPLLISNWYFKLNLKSFKLDFHVIPKVY
jgi:hypothetical protein